MKRPHSNKVNLTREQSLNRTARMASRVTFSNPLGDRQLTYTRGDRTWVVTATKRLPWTVRAERRRANKIARLSRKRNRHAHHGR